MSKKVTILGAGVSGKGAALLAAHKGYEVFVSDKGSIPDATKKVFKDHSVSFEENQHTLEKILSAELVIKSPGIPPTVKPVQACVENGIPVIDELEFAGRYLTSPCILVTGTNGKTTTTLLTAHLLNSCGLKAQAVGNVGTSLAESLIDNSADVFVVEASSFQLDGMKDFKADAALLLNITPDHLDRYGSMENYAASKLRIRGFLKEEGWFIYPAGDKYITPGNTTGREFSLGTTTYAGITGGELYAGESFRFPFEEMILKGDHNKLNALAAVTACLKLTGDHPGISDGLRTFTPVPHRLEWVASIGGVEFINDSKATNVEAVQYALDSFDNPLVWIAGGVDKGNNYESIRSLVDSNVHSMVCLGVDNTKLIAAFGNDLDQVAEASSMKEAVRNAWSFANPKDTVLLSPACASFDLFRNYEDRGRQFREEVLILKETVERGTYEQS